jgi:acetyl-CoA acyltransferase
MNMARIASMVAGIPQTAAATTVNRFCSSGSQAIMMAANQIMQ